MYKALVLVLFAFLSVVPAFAKHYDVHPMSCDLLWDAIKTVLNNPNDYAVLGMNDEAKTARFIVLGELKPYTDKVALTSTESGCAMKLVMTQIGPDYSDERVFRKQLRKALAKLQAAQPAKPTEAPKP